MVPKQFNLGDEAVSGVEIGFIATEPWSEIKLDDGGRLRMRLTVQRVYQLVDASNQPLKDAEGRRRYVIESKNELVVQD